MFVPARAVVPVLDDQIAHAMNIRRAVRRQPLGMRLAWIISRDPRVLVGVYVGPIAY